METSCLTNTNVADAFETLIEDTSRDFISNDNNLKIDHKDQDNNKKKSSCC